MIKGFKHMKMATIITLSVAVISLLCLSCLYLGNDFFSYTDIEAGFY